MTTSSRSSTPRGVLGLLCRRAGHQGIDRAHWVVLVAFVAWSIWPISTFGPRDSSRAPLCAVASGTTSVLAPHSASCRLVLTFHDSTFADSNSRGKNPAPDVAPSKSRAPATSPVGGVNNAAPANNTDAYDVNGNISAVPSVHGPPGVSAPCSDGGDDGNCGRGDGAAGSGDSSSNGGRGGDDDNGARDNGSGSDGAGDNNDHASGGNDGSSGGSDGGNGGSGNNNGNGGDREGPPGAGGNEDEPHDDEEKEKDDDRAIVDGDEENQDGAEDYVMIASDPAPHDANPAPLGDANAIDVHIDNTTEPGYLFIGPVAPVRDGELAINVIGGPGNGGPDLDSDSLPFPEGVRARIFPEGAFDATALRGAVEAITATTTPGFVANSEYSYLLDISRLLQQQQPVTPATEGSCSDVSCVKGD